MLTETNSELLRIVRVSKIQYSSLPQSDRRKLINICASISEFGQLINPLILVRTGTEKYQLVARQEEMSAVLFGEFNTINAWVFSNMESAYMACKLNDIKMIEELQEN